MTPTRSGSSLAMSRPESFTAMSAAASANWMKRSFRRTSLRSMYFSGSNPFTSPAMRVGKVEASNWVIGPIPLLPGDERPPGLLHADAHGADDAQPGDDDSAPAHRSDLLEPRK